MSSSSSSSSSAPHILAVPYPLHGHVAPMLQLCRKLSSNGIAVSLVNILVNTQQNQLIFSPPMANAAPPQEEGQPSSIMHQHTVVHNVLGDMKMDMEGFRVLLRSFESLRDVVEPLVGRLRSSGAAAATPALTHLLSDVHLGWTQDVADKYELRSIRLWTSNVSELAIYFQVPRLISQGYLPFKGADKDEVSISGIPGLPPLNRKDFPSLLQSEDGSDILYTYFINQTKRIPEADCILVNSFYELEGSVIDSLRGELGPKVHPIGPLLFGDENEPQLDVHSGSDICTEEDKCMRWLNAQAPMSVLYVSFGSFSPIPNDQILEFALGLEASQQPFLWVFRPTLVAEGSNPLPEDYDARVRDRALVVPWAPQLRVLSHPSTGGFLTHCGWNSTLESISAGVPMLCWPLGVDQPLTRKLILDEWKLGCGIQAQESGHAKAEEVQAGVRVLMKKQAAELRRRAAKLKGAAMEAVKAGGSSFRSLGAFVHEVKNII